MLPEEVASLAPGVVLGRGARATEALLLAELERRAAEARADLTLLAKPVRVVVPSRSLRDHLCTRLVESGAVAGVHVQTLNGLALDVLRGAPGQPARADALLPILVRQVARREPALRRVLEPLEDAWGAVVSAVRDLLDAGFDPAGHREALEECIAGEPLPGETRERARAVVRTAAGVTGLMAELRNETGGGRLARAAALLEREPARLPARAVLVHGFADATGVASDLIQALVRHHGATVLVDRPPDLADPERTESGVVFTERLVQRLGGPARVAEVEHFAPAEVERFAPAEVELVQASGATAEVRAAGERIRELLSEGVAPESIGLVARSLQPYRIPIRVQLGRLGIPFSAVGASAPASGVERRLHALVDLLAQGGSVPVDRWLDAWVGPRHLRMDLRIAFHVLGAPRLDDVTRLDLEAALGGREYLSLPVGRGIQAEAVEEGSDEDAVGGGVRKRSIAARDLQSAVHHATAVRDSLGAWPDPGPFEAHAEALRELARTQLAWPSGEPATRSLTTASTALQTEIPAAFGLERDDLVALLRPMLGEVAAGALGGEGAGIQVLSVTAARARTFEHLFVLGLNRDVFPRPVTDDPLLPDGLRRRLEVLLPEIPIQRRALDEERYLFAQLLSASPRVTVSWQAVDEEGRARAPSPLVEPLRLGRAEEPRVAPSLPARPATPERPRPAHESALLEGLYGSRAGFEGALAAALRERAAMSGVDVDERLAPARARVLRELERSRGRPGPYLGLVGAPRSGDPRLGRIFVTRLEGICRCPWQSFVEKLLSVEAPPDSLESLPTVTPLIRGSVVHDALESLVGQALGDRPEALQELRDSEPVFLPRPADEEVEAHLRAAARKAIREEGISLPGFDNLLVASARPLAHAARDLAWPSVEGGAGVLGVEIWGDVEVLDGDGRRVVLGFRVDRVDKGPEGLRLFDYKTGKAVSDAVRDETRRGHLRTAVARGKLLQAAAYALASGGSGTYLYLVDPESNGARAGIGREDEDLLEAFRGRVAQALDAIAHGAFFPRLVDDTGKRPWACDGCGVASACVQGDATARHRLLGWLRDERPVSDAERALCALWEDAP